MAIRDILAAIAIFVNGAKGHSALAAQPRSGLPVQDGLRPRAQDPRSHRGRARPAVWRSRRQSKSMARTSAATSSPRTARKTASTAASPIYQTGKRRGRRRHARARRPRPCRSSRPQRPLACPSVSRTVAPGSTIYADEASHWDALEARFLTKRINHSRSLLRRRGLHEPGRKLLLAASAAPRSASTTTSPAPTSPPMRPKWRGARINRRVSNGEQFLAMTARRWAIRCRGFGRAIGNGGGILKRHLALYRSTLLESPLRHPSSTNLDATAVGFFP